MKLLLKFLPVLFFGTAVLSSCSNTVTYAEQLKAEKELIADYIARNNIKVVSEMPDSDAWGDNVYYHTSSGIYFHMEDRGETTGDTIAANDLVVTRYLEITLDAKPDTTSYWNTIDYAYPTTFNYLDYTQACTGFHEAATYMRYNNSRARFIVPSKIGFSTTSSDVIPYLYEMKMKFQK